MTLLYTADHHHLVDFSYFLPSSLNSSGGGGGAGGYVEGYIENLRPGFNFFLASGGLGSSTGDGESAQVSFFGDENEIFAEGGHGGRASTSVNNFLRIGKGGEGGSAGGGQAAISATGGAGADGCIFLPTAAGSKCMATGGNGGSNSAGSASTSFASTLSTFEENAMLPGAPGWFFGAGGSGGKSTAHVGFEGSTDISGGDGASAFLQIQEFG